MRGHTRIRRSTGPNTAYSYKVSEKCGTRTSGAYGEITCYMDQNRNDQSTKIPHDVSDPIKLSVPNRRVTCDHNETERTHREQQPDRTPHAGARRVVPRA